MGKDLDKQDLFGNQIENNDWQEEWQGMPEFVQEDQKPYQEIIVRFDSEKDVRSFAKLIGQNLTCQTQSIWIPKEKKFTGVGKKRYVDE